MTNITDNSRDEGAHYRIWVGGAGGNCRQQHDRGRAARRDFIVANTDAQALTMSRPSASFSWALR